MERVIKFLKKNKTKIAGIVITLAVGSVSAFVSGNYDTYEAYNKPVFSPPGWLFPIVWTVLYIMMGFAAGIIAESRDLDRGFALKLYVLQLSINVIWPILFFRFNAPKFALFWLALLIVVIVLTIKNFRTINKTAGNLLIPYLLWCVFAFYLNFGIVVLNS